MYLLIKAVIKNIYFGKPLGATFSEVHESLVFEVVCIQFNYLNFSPQKCLQYVIFSYPFSNICRASHQPVLWDIFLLNVSFKTQVIRKVQNKMESKP